MKYKFFFVSGYYSEYWRELYERTPKLAERSYRWQMKTLLGKKLGVADFYSKGLEKLGQETETCFYNCPQVQLAWLKEKRPSIFVGVWVYLMLKRVQGGDEQIWPEWLARLIVQKQIENFEPDVIYTFYNVFGKAEALRQKNKGLMLVLHSANPKSLGVERLKHYDLVITTADFLVRMIRELGVNCELLNPGFEVNVAMDLKRWRKKILVLFVGSLSPDHKQRLELLNYVAEKVPELELYGRVSIDLQEYPHLKEKYRGPLDGVEMLEAIYNARIVIHSHVDMAKGAAHAMRLFEVAGLGSLLLTDEKTDRKCYEDGKEMVIYISAHDCVKKIRYYLAKEKERQAIAKAGRNRTKKDHVYKIRMRELLGIIDKYHDRISG